MPTLEQATSYRLDPEKYTPVAPRPPANTTDLISIQRAPSFIRCPLPPVSVTPDSLRQFDTPTIPQMRTMTPSSIPSNNGGNGNTTIIGGGGNTTVVSGGGGGTVVVPTSIQNASITTPVLSQNQSIRLSAALSTVFILLRVTVTAPARIRMYSTQAAQVADLGRAQSTPIVIGSENAIIADMLLTAPSELAWTCSPAIVGFNDDNVRVNTCYITVTNPVGSSTAITASFSFAVVQA